MTYILPYAGIRPRIAKSAFIAPGATIVGDVEIGEESSVWYGAVLRGDVMPIRIGARTSIQDNAVIHATGGWRDAVVGDDATIGHGVILHGCSVGNRVLVGMGSILLDAAEVGDDVMIGAGSLVTARTRLPSRHLVFGRPAKAIRAITEEELAHVHEASELYRGYARAHRAALGEER